jgi:hypothetical protein
MSLPFLLSLPRDDRTLIFTKKCTGLSCEMLIADRAPALSEVR